MAEAAAVVADPVVPAPAPAAEAAPEQAAKPRPESLEEQWGRIERGEPAPAEEAPAEGEKAEAKDGEKPGDKKPRPKREEKPAKEPAPGGELESLRQQATRLGFVVEDGKVTTRERADFRAAQRKASEGRAADERSLLERIEKAKSEAAPQIERANKLEAALAAADWEQIAVTLGFKTVAAVGDKPGLSAWDALIQDQIDRKADPNYQRLRKLEMDAAERAERDARAAEDAQARQEQQQQAPARANYMRGLSDTMKASKDPLIAAFHGDNGFVGAIFAIQEQEYRATGSVPAPEQASRMKLTGVNETPREWLEGLHRRLSPVFGAPVAAPAAAATTQPAPKPANGKAPAPRTAPVPKPAARRLGGWESDRAQKDDMIRRLEEAAARDAAEERKTGTMPR